MKRTKKRSGLRILGYFLKGSLGLFALGIAANLFATLLTALVPQIISFTIDSVIGTVVPEGPYAGFVAALGGLEYVRGHMWLVALAIGVVATLIGVFGYLRIYLTKRADQTMARRMRDLLFSHIQRLPLSWHRAHRTGDIIQRCTSDADTISNFVSDRLVTLVRIVILTVLSLVMMFLMHPALAAIAAAFVPVLLGSSIAFQNFAHKHFRKCDEQEGVLSALAQENFSGARVVRAFGRERRERDRFERQNVYYTGLWMKINRALVGYWTLGDMLVSIQLLVILVVGTGFCVRGGMTVGQLVAFISYNTMLMEPVRQLGRIISNLSKAGVSIDRIAEIVDAEEEPYGTVGALSGDIVFDRVSFGYAPDRPVLDGVSFVVPQGTTLGIVGPTGSGKSTLAALLDRLSMPTGGRISIGGVDLEALSPATLRAHIGLVLQDGHLFGGTIADNLSIAAEGADTDAVRAAARAACVADNIESFANGYDTLVGERGVTLSGGQKQRVAIARTLLRNTPYLIFDDSLSAVDSETDAAIRANLAAFGKDRTVLIIAHRIATVMHADNIIVLQNGRIAECGTHAQLLARDGLYRRIYDAQTSLPGELTEATV